MTSSVHREGMRGTVANFFPGTSVQGFMDSSQVKSSFLFWSRATLLLVYLVILAGSIVRATGSGMGCPDWPMCFGHLVPPTQLEEIQYIEGKEFRKGHFIIRDEALWKAKHDLVAGSTWNPGSWEKYTKHGYARFNAAHTWTEYINRLMGALLGIASLLMLVSSFRIRHHDTLLPALSALTVFLIGFEAWLGATVVESNLAPAKITTHMVVAVFIVGVVLTTVHRAGRIHDGVQRTASNVNARTSFVVRLLLLSMAATVGQIILGTQVREQVDMLDKTYGTEMRAFHADKLDLAFQFHRAFAYVIIVFNVLVVYLLWRRYPGWLQVRTSASALVCLLVLGWATGAGLIFFGLPALLQPAHLLLAVIIFGVQFHLWARIRLNRVLM